jgi:hypothetical protein
MVGKKIRSGNVAGGRSLPVIHLLNAWSIEE